MQEADPPCLTPRLFWRLLKTAAVSWVDNRSPHMGAALAFYSLLSVSPLLLLVLTAATYIWGREAAQGQIVEQIAAIVGNQSAEAIQTILAAQHGEDTGLLASLLGIGMLFFSASGVFGELQDAMNKIWRAPPRQERAIFTLLRERFLSFTMVVSSGFLLLTSLAVSAWLAAVTHYVTGLLPDFLVMMRLVDFLIGFGVITLIFALIYKIVPDVKIAWRGVWLGSALAALLFLAGKMLFGLYLGYAAVTSAYGAAGSLVVLLLWVYYSSQILFFGAEFSHAYARHFNLHPYRASA